MVANEDTAHLTEHLKTLRVLHQLLVVVSAAILAFALRADQSKEYRAALVELTALKETRLDTWTTFVHEHYRSYEDQNDRFVREIVRRAGLPMQGKPRLNEPVFGDMPPYAETLSLLQFDSFISGIQKIGVLKLNANKKEVAEQLKRSVVGRNSHPVVSGMWLSGFQGGYGQQMLDWRNPPLVPTVTLNFNISDQPQTTPNTPVWVVLSFTLWSENGHFAAAWLRNDVFGKKLFDSKTGEFLPHLKVFWEKVNGLNSETAMAFLEGQLDASSRGSLSFFGIPVERDLVILAAPIVCFSILLFFCAHIRQFRVISDDVNSVPRYPFVALFQSPVSALSVIYGTVLLLPIFANEELLRRFGPFHERTTQVAGAFFIAMVGLSVWSVVELHGMRKRWFHI